MDEKRPEQLRALGDPLRLALLRCLHRRGETCVCELTGELGCGQSNLSMHLRVLRSAGLVASQKIGKWVFYRLNREELGGLLAWLGATFEATSAADRPAGGLYACCVAGEVPLSLAQARGRLVGCTPAEGDACHG